MGYLEKIIIFIVLFIKSTYVSEFHPNATDDWRSYDDTDVI